MKEAAAKLLSTIASYKKVLEGSDFDLDGFSLELSLPPAVTLDFKLKKHESENGN